MDPAAPQRCGAGTATQVSNYFAYSPRETLGSLLLPHPHPRICSYSRETYMILMILLLLLNE